LRGWFGSRRQVPWAGVRDLEHHGQSATLTADGERILLDEDTFLWRYVFQAIERHLGSAAEPSERSGEMAAEEVAQCLGIAVDGFLEYRPSFGWVLPVVAALFAALPVALAFSIGKPLLALPWLALPFFCVLLGVLIRRGCQVRADVSGLVLGCGKRCRRVPWSAVRRIDEAAVPLYERRFRLPRKSPKPDRSVVVSIEAGLFTILLDNAGGEQLAAGIRALVAARDAGHALPSQAPLSDAALSQARMTGDADAQRGISQVNEP
jgi:hypothetical protein